MQPEQPQNSHGVSMEYLNQIAPQTPKKIPFSKFQLLVFGGIILVIIVVVAGIVAALGSNTGGSSTERLAARLLSTAIIADKAQPTIKSTQLQTLNSNLRIYLTNTNRDIATPLKSIGLDVAHLDPAVIKAESGVDVTAKLEDARLNAVFDKTYAREMSYRLDTIVNLMQQIDASTNSSSLKTFLNGAYTNLKPTQQQFSDFNATNG
jgi:hypothetical protein